jgi:DNA polymerase III subunit epsilon
LTEIRKLLGKYVNKYDKQDKFVLGGYNVGFDMDMMRVSFEKAGDNYFGSWFFWPVIDVRVMVAEQILEIGLRLPNYKLETVCEYFNIPIDAHNALSDIRATRQLYYFLKGE